MAMIRNSSKRNSAEAIKQGKGEAAYCTYLPIGQVQIGFDRFDKNSKNLPVEHAERVRKHEQKYCTARRGGPRWSNGGRSWRSIMRGSYCRRVTHFCLLVLYSTPGTQFAVG
ncbi:hypothetical protein CBM2623_B30100 [Cupriavidus taiwanensis]|nr:hypothetical protein CBM2608_B30099 [Cupriavidus taiwanensis]SPA34453.1 hypothetical protein CBM2623_B30100 [Cupriavidus taiwanensis]